MLYLDCTAVIHSSYLFRDHFSVSTKVEWLYCPLVTIRHFNLENSLVTSAVFRTLSDSMAEGHWMSFMTFVWVWANASAYCKSILFSSATSSTKQIWTVMFLLMSMCFLSLYVPFFNYFKMAFLEFTETEPSGNRWRVKNEDYCFLFSCLAVSETHLCHLIIHRCYAIWVAGVFLPYRWQKSDQVYLILQLCHSGWTYQIYIVNLCQKNKQSHHLS